MQISEQLIEKVHNYLNEHKGYHDQELSAQQDAYVYNLIRLIKEYKDVMEVEGVTRNS